MRVVRRRHISEVFRKEEARSFELTEGVEGEEGVRSDPTFLASAPGRRVASLTEWEKWGLGTRVRGM